MSLQSRTHNVRRKSSRKRHQPADGLRQLEALEQRQLLAAVVATTPINLSIGVGVHAHVQATFDGSMTASTINSTTFRLYDASNNVIAGRVTYNNINFMATFDSTAQLAYGATYHAVLTSGVSGVKDASNGTLAADVSWSFTAAVNPTAGTGGPVLVVTSTANPFGTYYAEILRGEGLNAFNTADISTVSAASLANYTVVILSEMTLSAGQVTTLTNWVNGGGNLIAMRPDKQLASLLGLTDANATLTNTYLQVNTGSGPGAGIVGTTMQYHGTADRYTLSGATAVATLFSNANSALVNPAVTMRSVGANGGQAAAFTYDLAKSVIYTRQGNPAWAGQDRDNDPLHVTRSDDMFFGAASFDPQPDWVDLTRVQIPQADEQQRLLANMILSMNMDKMPLPRLWYLPNGNKALIVMTGDDHALNGAATNTPDYFNTFNSLGSSGGQQIRGTSYLVDNAGMTDAELAQFVAQGFELALHIEVVDGNHVTRNWVSKTDLENIYATEMAAYLARYPTATLPQTNRTHGIIWSDYDSQPQVEFINGIRLDTNYYYWPGSWANTPGLFTGSGMAQRFAKADGTLVDVYQATTQFTDENTAASFPGWVNLVLDNALGAPGYYGAFVVNAHTDNPSLSVAQGAISAAQAHNVPVVTAESLLNFTDGRNGTQFSSLTWNANTLGFTLTAGYGANGLQAMLPVVGNGNVVLSTLSRNGSAVSFTLQNIKGVTYAFFNAVSGNYTATYITDTAAPTILSRNPSNGATGIPVNVTPRVTFSEMVVAGTISMVLRNSSNQVIAGSFTYDLATRTATFSPTTPLNFNATYTLTVSGAQDANGNTMTSSVASFTTGTTGPFSFFGSFETPGTINTTDTSAISVGVKFSTAISGFINGIRFYKGDLNTGAHIGSLYSSSGTLLATATFSGESASGWQEVLFNTPVAVTAGVTYVAAYHTTVGRYSADSGYFSASGLDRGYIHMVGGSEGSNGVYSYGSSPSFPNQSFGAANYWVDVVFNVGADTTPPTISDRSPAVNATGVSPSTSVTVTFSEAINSATLSLVLRNASNQVVASNVSYDSVTRTATLTPTSTLALSSTFTATVSASDTAGNALSATSWSFTTASSAVTNYSVWSSSVTPATTATSDTSAVEVGMKFRSTQAGYITAIRFYKGTTNTGAHVGNLWSSTGTLLATVNFTGESASGWQEMALSNPVAITANTTYLVSYFAPNGRYALNAPYFTAGVTNGPLTALANGTDGGNGLYRYNSTSAFPNQTFNSSNYWVDVVFTTTPPADTTPPTITARTPAVNATGVSPSTTVTVTFSEAINSSTLLLELRNASNQVVASNVTYDAPSRTATLTPTSTLALSATFTATVSASDTAGNAMSATSWSFTTASSVVTTYSVWSNSVTPAVTADSDTGAVEVGMKFRSSQAGYINSIRFYKGSTNTGTHVGHLWSSTGTLLATVTFTGESASGWQEMALSNPVAITANTTYVVSYYVPSGHYAVNAGYFSSAASNGPLTGLANGTDGANGLFLYASGGGFPNQSFNSSNYWVDVVFSTTPPVDNTPPTITNRTPGVSATGVSPSTTVTVTFNEAINSATLSLVLRNASNQVVASNVSYDSVSRTATLTPTSTLALSSTFTATVSASDTAGNAMSATSWSFTTAASAITTYSVWSNSVTPAVTADGDTSAVEVGTKFRSSQAGYINAIRFYKGTTNTGVHIGSLWSSTGTLLATVTFSGESASGWQEMALSNPVAISADTTYIVSYFAPNGHYAVNSGYFSSAAANGPLTALANGTDGSNGLYRYTGSSAFPNQSFNSSNYWVDVVFSTTPPVDNTAPTITARTPAVNATGVSPSTTVTVTFNEAINSATLSLVLRNAANQVVASNVSYDSASRTATLTPTATLALSSTYSATVSVNDTAGNTLNATTWSFTTAASAVTTYSVWSNSVTPAVTADGDTDPVEVGTKFRSSQAGYINALRFYKGSTNTGTHVGHLWSSTGTLLATVTFTGESASGWQEMALSNPVAISANTTYVVSYYAPNGHYAVNSGYFSSASTNGPLTALANGTDGANGLFRYVTGGGFPNQSFNSSNYWVDVVFSTTPPVDSTPPTITDRTPGMNATSVAPGTTVTVTFNEAINSATLSLVLRNASNQVVASNVSYDSASRTATLTPTSSLALSSTFTATVSASDTAGNAMSATSWSFTTAATVSANVSSIWSNATTPSFVAENDGVAIEVGVKFRASVTGYVMGVRFYKGAANTGAHVGKLYDSSGTLLATVTFANESASGWQNATFSNPVQISANTTYVVAYYSPNGYYAADNGYFASSGVTNGPLTALANGVDGSNGLFRYGTGGGFPNSSFNGGNYWVDVLFSTAATLAVQSRSPISGATAVAVSSNVTATFNTAINPSTVSLVLRNAANQVIPATVTYDPLTLTVTLDPTSNLTAASVFTATLSASDPLGNAMTPVVWSFTTA